MRFIISLLLLLLPALLIPQPNEFVVQAATTCESQSLSTYSQKVSNVAVGTVVRLKGLPVVENGVETGELVLGADVRIEEVFKGNLSTTTESTGEFAGQILVATQEPLPYDEASPAGEVVYTEGQRYLFFLQDGKDSLDYPFHVTFCNGTRALGNDLATLERTELSGSATVSAQSTVVCEKKSLTAYGQEAYTILIGTVNDFRFNPDSEGAQTGILAPVLTVEEILKDGDRLAGITAGGGSVIPDMIFVSTVERVPYNPQQSVSDVTYTVGQRYLFFLQDGFVSGPGAFFHVPRCNGTRALTANLTTEERNQILGTATEKSGSSTPPNSSSSSSQTTSTPTADGKGGPPETLAQSGIDILLILITLLGMGVAAGAVYRVQHRLNR